MSLKKFSELFGDLDSINSTNNKIEVLKNYFLSNDPIDNSWAIYLLTGKSNKRFISGRYLKNLFCQIYEYPEWLINTCYLNEDHLISGKIERIKDVNVIPSPYLSGAMDEFFDQPLIPLFETTRGCPFACAFCADGQASKNKIHRYDPERTKEELNYIAKK